MPSITQRRADISKIAAIHHPLRRRLMEMLGVDGPATASQLAERSGQLVGNVSHHLKMLAKAGLIEEAEELAKDRRERWWRSVPMSLSWSVADMEGNTADELVAEAAEQQNLSHHVDKVHQWFEHRGNYSTRLGPGRLRHGVLAPSHLRGAGRAHREAQRRDRGLPPQRRPRGRPGT